jgi:hypothetical protein
MNREGENYLNNYPLYSDFIDWIYKRGFPVIYVTLVTIKKINECLSLSLIFDIVSAMLIITHISLTYYVNLLNKVLQ